jgi:xanthine dehydrogenase accessory factor
VKHWLETREVLDGLAALVASRKRAALATVVRVQGSAYRHEGAKMLVSEAGATVGNVSGGCLEADVREVAFRVMRTGEPQLCCYCAGADEIAAWDLGMGCEGKVEVLIELVEDPRASERELLRGTVAFASCSLLDVQGPRLLVTEDSVEGSLRDLALNEQVTALARELLSDGASGTHVVAGREVFIDVLSPPPQLVIVSGGDDARALAQLGAQIGFRVVVADRRSGLLTRTRFPRVADLVVVTPDRIAESLDLDDDTYAVVMTHNYVDDRDYLSALLATEVCYVGMLGPRQRTERMIEQLELRCPIVKSRIYGPVGLDIGTDGAEQIALSAIAEILAVRSGRQPVPLRTRHFPIHADVPEDVRR